MKRTCKRSCTHLAQPRTTPVTPRSRQCRACLEEGSPWVHLRLCLACGHVGCCDSSPRRHAAKHHLATGHPVVLSFEPGETWAYCYPDDLEVDRVPVQVLGWTKAGLFEMIRTRARTAAIVEVI